MSFSIKRTHRFIRPQQQPPPPQTSSTYFDKKIGKLRTRFLTDDSIPVETLPPSRPCDSNTKGAAIRQTIISQEDFF